MTIYPQQVQSFSFAVYKFAVRLTNKGIQFPVSKKLAVFAFAGNQQKNSGFKVRQFLPVLIWEVFKNA